MKCLKKLLLLFLLSCTFMFCIPVLSSNSFAAISYTYNGNKITLPEIPEKEGCTNYIIYYEDTNPNVVQLKLFPTDLSYYPTVYKPNGCLAINTYNTVSFLAPSYFYDVEKGSGWTKTSDSGYIGAINPSNIVACTTDIYYTDGKQKTDDKPFFQVTPQVVLAPQVEEIQLSQTLEEVLGILPMTLVVLVSLVGLRKGLKMLETFLYQS